MKDSRLIQTRQIPAISLVRASREAQRMGSTGIEPVRRFLRPILGDDVYFLLSGILTTVIVFFAEGPARWLTLFKLAFVQTNASPPPIQVNFKRLHHPFHIRQGNFVDVAVVTTNIVREEYGQLDLPRDPEWIIDGGAYIGDTAAYFLSRYPKVNVIALEPGAESYKMAHQNLKPYKERAILLNQGLWGSDTTLKFGGDLWGASVRKDGYEINCVSIPTLLRLYRIPKVDILKLDIEGAEENLFASAPEKWLPLVDHILIETHGAAIEKQVFGVLERNHFKIESYRTIWYCTRGADV
jgi:FkbM family methyltransferase